MTNKKTIRKLSIRLVKTKLNPVQEFSFVSLQLFLEKISYGANSLLISLIISKFADTLRFD